MPSQGLSRSLRELGTGHEVRKGGLGEGYNGADRVPAWRAQGMPELGALTDRIGLERVMLGQMHTGEKLRCLLSQIPV